MANQSTKKKSKIKFMDFLFYSLVVAIVSAGMWTYHQQSTQLDTLNQDIKVLEQKYADATLEVEGTQRMLEYANSDEYLEFMARNIYGWARENEIIYYDIDKEQ